VSQRAASASRAAGVLLPLFALRGERDRGIGEIGDLPAFCRWLASAGHGLLQLLPITELPSGERSPYGAMSAFAIDPIYLSLEQVEDVFAAGATAGLPAAPGGAGVDYDAVRALKRRTLEAAFEWFLAHEWGAGSRRADAFRRFRAARAVWLDDYALFRACQDRRGQRSWREWEPPLRDRAPAALREARESLADARLFHEYVQWQCAEQWAAARREIAGLGIGLVGDLPFVVSGNSADVWARQEEFALDVTLGAPPDAFNAGGQEWGLPVYRWDAMESTGFAWLRARAAHAGALFDAFRIDHVVGLYRQYVIGPGGPRGFVPPDEGEQVALGERLLATVLDAAAGAQVIGEDLGVVPPFVRRSLTRLGIPGYRVLRWEADGGVFRDPASYPALSLATSGTHDTSALAAWWEKELGVAGRQALAAVPAFAALADAPAEFTPAVHTALLDGLYAAGSDLLVLPFPDAYGGRERINVPATVGRSNWDYRLPWTIGELHGAAGAALAARLRAFAERHGRR
jgi:4-alpha-glucanotransferase